jgi:transposase
MNGKEKRGIQIAATRKIERAGNLYAVPALKGNALFKVDLVVEPPKCTCPENRRHQVLCEHIFAAKLFRQREEVDNEASKLPDPPPKTKRKTYTQNWPVYNEAQMRQKDRFQSLFSELCDTIDVEEQKGVGRPRLKLRDIIFSAGFKVYTRQSGRNFRCDLQEAQRRGFVSHTPHYNSIFNYLEDPKLTPILQGLIVKSARPLRSIEVNFAVDSSGFETSRDGRYFEHAHGEKKERRQFVKCHLMCGVLTHVVVSVEISDAADTVLLPGLVKTAAEAFDIEDVCADKGYISHSNCEAIAQVGGTPFIMPKVDSHGDGSGAWGKMFHLIQFRKEEFMAHYHQRSNAESTFHMIKAKFGPGLLSRSDTGLINEALCKVLCHNIVVLNHAMLELKIDPSDWGFEPTCRKEEPTQPTVALVRVDELSTLTKTSPNPMPTLVSLGHVVRRAARGMARLLLRATE